MNKCPVCDILSYDINNPTVDYTTGFTFCDNHLVDAESLYRRMPLAGITALSSWLRCIADTRDNYHKSINSDKMYTDKIIDINKAKGYKPIAIEIMQGKTLDIVI